MADHQEPGSGNLGAVFDAHVKHEFVDYDVDATMQTMVAEPYLLHVPTMTGGAGPHSPAHDRLPDRDVQPSERPCAPAQRSRLRPV
jgi:carboxymethylenebutenolidase